MQALIKPTLLDEIITKSGERGYLVSFDDGIYRYEIRTNHGKIWIREDDVAQVIKN